jgi:putative molybdopterin biosynthesis protein
MPTAPPPDGPPDAERARFFSTREVAALLRMTERTVYELVREKQIPTLRVAGKWLFPRELIERWLDENTDRSSLEPRGDRTPGVLAGSHDPLLDWAVRESGCGLALRCDGSEDGLRRVADRQAIVAALHLLDDDGHYNLREFAALPQRRSLVLIEWARRRQGLVLGSGRAATVTSLRDVLAAGLRVAVRQPGSGSRRLLERLARRDGVPLEGLLERAAPARDESEVAEAIVAGRADVGIAIETVARAHRLDFVALHEERVDLLMRRFDFFEPPLQALLGFCRGDAFRERAAGMPGYDISGLGRVVANG